MLPGLPSAQLTSDAIEVGRILGAWGVKGWVKVLTHNQTSEALFASKGWLSQPPDPSIRPVFDAFTGTVLLPVTEVKVHSDTVVAKFQGLDDRSDAEAQAMTLPKYRAPWTI